MFAGKIHQVGQAESGIFRCESGGCPAGVKLGDGYIGISSTDHPNRITYAKLEDVHVIGEAAIAAGSEQWASHPDVLKAGFVTADLGDGNTMLAGPREHPDFGRSIPALMPNDDMRLLGAWAAELVQGQSKVQLAD